MFGDSHFSTLEIESLWQIGDAEGTPRVMSEFMKALNAAFTLVRKIESHT